MIREHTDFFRKFMILGDLLVISISFFLTYFLCQHYDYLYPLRVYTQLLPVLLIAWGGALYFFNMYNSFRLVKMTSILFIIFKATIVSFMIFGSYTYLFKIQYLSRTFVILTFVFSAILIGFEKVAVIIFFRYLRKKGYNFRGILLIGTGRRAQNFIDLIEEHHEWGLKILGLVDEDSVASECSFRVISLK